MAKFVIRQGETSPLPFRIKDIKTGRPMPLTGANFLLWVKLPEAAEPVIVKTDSNFDKSGVASGYVTTFLTIKDTVQEVGVYEAELKIVTADTPPRVEKLFFEFEILEGITPNNFVEVFGIVSLESVGEPVITQ